MKNKQVIGDIKAPRIQSVCKEGFILHCGSRIYAIRYGVTLATIQPSSNVLLVNDRYRAQDQLTASDLKVIRALDKTFKKKGDELVSEFNHICFADFV